MTCDTQFVRKIEKETIRPGLIACIAIVSAFLSSQLSLAGCSGPVIDRTIPAVPSSYFQAIEVDPVNLVQAYYPVDLDINIPVGLPEQMYNNQTFVFKNIPVTRAMLSTVQEGFIWINAIKCYPLESNGLTGLKAGDIIDIVGIDSGLCPDFEGSLQFSGCVFIFSGAVQIPASGSPTFALPYQDVR
jgi:hypothetical protein